MPAALVGGLIAAGGAVGAAEISSHGASEAAQQQTQANQGALNLATNVYNNTQSQYAPYRAIGTAALPQLAAYANAPVLQRKPGPVGYQPGYQPGMTLSGMSGYGQPIPVGSGQTPTAAAQTGGMVTLRAPDGTTQQFPANDPRVPHFIERGAQRV